MIKDNVPLNVRLLAGLDQRPAVHEEAVLAGGRLLLPHHLAVVHERIVLVVLVLLHLALSLLRLPVLRALHVGVALLAFALGHVQRHLVGRGPVRLAGILERGPCGGDAREPVLLRGELGVEGVVAVLLLGEASEVDPRVRLAVERHVDDNGLTRHAGFVGWAVAEET